MTAFDPLDPSDDPMREVVNELTDRTRKIGLYLEGATLAAQDPEVMQKLSEDPSLLRKFVEDGEEIVIVGTFAIGDMAFSTMVTDPEQHEFNVKAREIMPDPVDELKEKLRKASEEGKSIFDLDEDGDA